MKRSAPLLLLALFLWTAHDSQVWASGESLCIRWFQKKHYLMAAKCFQRLSNGKAPKMKRGNWVRNAALAYKKAAAKEQKSRRANVLREKGVELLKRYIKDKLYSTQTQLRIARNMKESLVEKIGYVNLTVLPGDPKARVKVIGYKYKRSLTGTGVLQLRPGSYTVLVTYPNQSSDAKAVSLSPGKPHILRFGGKPKPRKVAKRAVKKKLAKKRPLPRPSAPKPRGSVPVGWILAGVGGVVLATGAVLLGVSFGATHPEAAATLNQAIANKDAALTRKAGVLQQQAQLLHGVGWGALGTGVAVLGLGLVLALTGKKPAKQSLPTTPTNASSYQPLPR